MSTEIWDATNKLDSWIERNGWAGYDPYDIKELPTVIKITELGNRNLFFTLVRECVFEILYSFPTISREILGVKRSINPKGMGLLAKAYLNLYQIIKDEKYLNKSKECLKWLEINCSQGYAGKCWGYPFNWQSIEFIPKGTPSGVVTSIVGESFWSFYNVTKRKEYLEDCKSICKFLMNNLNLHKIDNTHICFSYTPITHDHIHNANLLVAEFLMKIGTETNNQEYIDCALKAMNYSMSYQNKDGSFYYTGPPDIVYHWIDHYHTGFVIRSLYSIFKITRDKDLLTKLKKCYEHYIANFFKNNVVPKFQPNRIYPIDIHSCSEAIICLSELSEKFSEGRELAKNVANWTIDNMQDKEGHFYHAKRKSRFTQQIFTAKIPYMRWGQAWMLLALSTLLNSLNCGES